MILYLLQLFLHINLYLRSLAYWLTGSENEHGAVRKHIIDYIEQELAFFDAGKTEGHDWFLLFKYRNAMTRHVNDKRYPAKSAAEVEKWASNVDLLAAARLYGINVLVHVSNIAQKTSAWQVYNPYADNALFLSTPASEKFSVYINYVNRNHYQVICDV